MAQAVLGFWVATAFVGAYMFTFTTGVARSRAEAAAGQLTSRLPPLALFVHPLIGITGLLTWIAYLATDQQALAWTTLVVLVAGIAIGELLLLHTLRGGKDAERHAEERIPKAALVSHGVLAAVTVGLVFLVCLGVDSQSEEEDRDYGRTLGVVGGLR